ncbi:NIPSNAP family protein [Streptomyces sp. NPDC054829]
MLTPLPDRLSVIELRQYILLPGRRKEFVDLFDKELVESQEVAGIAVLGQFTDTEDPDRIVWLRGFADMQARHQALTTFYDSPAWHQFGHLAVAPKKPDLDDILLLRPLQQDQPVPFTPAGRLPLGAPTPQRDVTITVWFFAPGSDRGPGMIRDTLLPRLQETDPTCLLALATEPAPNTFPQLPVRTGVNATVVLTTHPAQHAPATHPADLAATMIPALAGEQVAPAQVLRLTPTSRSAL